MAVSKRKLARKGSKATLRAAANAANHNLSYAVKYHAVYDAVVGAINPEFLKNVDTLLSASFNGRPGVSHGELFALTRKAALAVLKTDIAPLAADTEMDGSYGDSANLPLANADLPAIEDSDNSGATNHQPENGEGK